MPDDRAFTTLPPHEVEATIAGEGWDLMYFFFFAEHYPIVFNLNELPIDILNRELIIDRISNQLGSDKLSVKDISLDYISLNYEARMDKRLPVKFAKQLRFEPEFQLRDSIQLQPDTILVSGPVSLVDSLLFWPTDTTDLGLLKEDFEEKIGLKPSPGGGILDLRPEKVNLYIPVDRFVEKSFLFVPVEVRNAPDSLRIFPAAVKVTAVVGMSRFDQLSASDFTVEADLSGFALNEEYNTVPLKIDTIPKGVSSVRINPASVEFFFEVSDSTGFEVPIQPAGSGN
jgi:hypothetical protein